VIAALWVVALGLGGPPLVTARVNRTHVAVGDAVVLTVQARTRSPQPLTVALPRLPGFTLLATREVRDVSLARDEGGGALRTILRQLTLRAERPGHLVIGPVQVRQSGVAVTTRAISITVDSATGPAAALSPPARALLEGAPSPERGDEVSLAVLVPGDSVLIGQQLDVLVAAWFPRDVRLRLRAEPRMSLATPPGAWSYAEERPEESVAARRVRGRWMDVYALHEILFPLEAGRLRIPPAAVEYGVPVSFSIFSREEHYALRSDSIAVTVLAPPATGRPADDRQVAGTNLSLALAVAPADAHVGEPLTVLATVSGVGNAALWPEPLLRWPSGFRAYPTETRAAIESQDGLIGGSRTFSYLVVPDSVGSFTLPEVRYPYYDVGAGRYVVARAPPQSMAVLPGAEPRPARALPPLLPSDGEWWPDTLARALTPWGWVVLLLGAPLVAALARRGRPRPSAPDTPAPTRSRLGRLESAFHAVLANHVPDAAVRDGDGLARALRAAGVESAVADHVQRVRDRLRAARYGPQGLGDAAELGAELEQILRVLGAEPTGARRRRIGVAVLCGALLGPRAGVAQAPEALYQAGALRAAADSFAARAAGDPGCAAHWYNLGATLYRGGADGKAVAAWAIALRLAPRSRVIARARALLPAPDGASDALLAVGMATPGEWALVAAVAWVLTWVAIAARRRPAMIGTLGAVAALAVLFGVREQARRDRPLAIVLAPATPIRVAPYGSASAATTLDAGSALVVERRAGGWFEVRRDDGVRGWVLGSEVVRL